MNKRESRLAALFDKYIKNECSEAELDELLIELNKKENDDLFDLFTISLWKVILDHGGESIDETQQERLRNEIRGIIGIAESKQDKKIGIYKHFTKIAAAIIIIIVSILSVYKYKETPSTIISVLDISNQYYKTDNSASKRVMLTDGTCIILNKNTSLHISKSKFNAEAREVWLDEGEAFFEVAKDSAKAFIVYAGELQTIVHGTSFNVIAYNELDENVVTVREGNVEIKNEDHNFGHFTGNMQLIYSPETKDGVINETDWHEVAGWLENRLVFINAGMKEIKLRMHQQFGKDVEIEDDVMQADIQCNASFEKNVTIEQVMERLSLLYGLDYRIDDDTLIIFE